MRKCLPSIIAIGLVTTAEAIAPKSYSVKFHAAQKFPAMFFPDKTIGTRFDYNLGGDFIRGSLAAAI